MTAPAPSVPVVRVRGRHHPGLDGLRAFAVSAVVAYHLFPRFSGGFLGVDLFFVLSGFLITSLLLEERLATARISFAAFWGRRAKRLLPALFLMLAVVVAYVAVGNHHGLFGGVAVAGATLRGDALAAVFYVANWHLILTKQSYFALLSLPSPLQHTWSLAIEEQYYLVFPFVLAGLVLLGAGARRRRGVLVLGALAVASAVDMALLFHHGASQSRIYYGTDSRAFDLLVGAALAFALTGRPEPGERVGRVLEVAAWPAAVALGVFWGTAGTLTDQPRSFMYQGGFLACALLAATVIATVVLRPRSGLARSLSLRPFVAVGAVSYGVYLWYWPVLDLWPYRYHLATATRDLAQVGLIAALTLASYFLLERPVRRHRFGAGQAAVAVPAAFAGIVAVVLVGTLPSVTNPSIAVPTVPVVATGPAHVVPGAGDFGAQAPIVLGRRVTPAHPLVVGLLGDSLIYDQYQGLSAALRATGDIRTRRFGIPGWGLTKTLLDPGKALRNVRRSGADIVVASWGWDNHVALTEPAAYERTLASAVSFLLAPGGVHGVILIPSPTPAGPLFGSPLSVRQNIESVPGERAWAAAAEAVAARFPGKVMVLPVDRSVLLPDGGFTDWLPPGNRLDAPAVDWLRVRNRDGYHLCQNGTVRYATALAWDLNRLFGTGMPRGDWWKGSWVSSKLYNTFGLSCPGDHPPAGTALANR